MAVNPKLVTIEILQFQPTIIRLQIKPFGQTLKDSAAKS